MQWKIYSSTATSASVSCPRRQSRALGLQSSSTRTRWHTSERGDISKTSPDPVESTVVLNLEQSWSTVSTKSTGLFLAHGGGATVQSSPLPGTSLLWGDLLETQQLAQQNRTKHNKVAIHSGFKRFNCCLNVYSLVETQEDFSWHCQQVNCERSDE